MLENGSGEVGELQRLKRERRELIHGAQRMIEKNHEAYQEKMKMAGQLLELFGRMS